MDETETLGKHLRRERELRQISLGDLSKNTRVREPILKAIEEDRYDLLPSPTFVKGFLTSYARYVGLDSNDIVQGYQAVLKGKLDTNSDVPPKKKTWRGGKSLWYISGFIVGGVSVAGLIIACFLFLQPSKPPAQSVPVNPAEKETLPSPPSPSSPSSLLPGPPSLSPSPSPSPSPSSTSPSPSSTSPSPSSPHPPASPNAADTNPPQKEILSSPPQIVGTDPLQKGKPISLRLKTIETTWLSAKVDDQSEKDMILRPGESVALEAVNQIYLLVGNAGGLDLIQNEKALEKFGKSGEVVALTFTPQGLDLKRFEKSKPAPSEVSPTVRVEQSR